MKMIGLFVSKMRWWLLLCRSIVYFPPTFEALSRVVVGRSPGRRAPADCCARLREKGWERGVALAIIVSCLLLSAMRDKIT